MVALGGCESPGTADVDERYELQAERRTFKVDVPLPEMDRDGGGGVISMPRGFLDEYFRRARSPMYVTPAVAVSAEDHKALELLMGWLHERGVKTAVRPSVFPTAGYGVQTVSLSFEAYVAMVPQCGDWSGHTGYNPSNANHTDFGCSINRNIGLMLSDPGDIIEARENAGGDTGRQMTVIEKYRAGQRTGRAGSEAIGAGGVGFGQ
jgi:pilus biogenesis lipoprotein CpaD